MAGTEQKQLLNLIRDFASEKSQGERRLIGLKKRAQELRAELETVNAETDQAKRLKESAVQKLKGYEIELDMLGSSIQIMESRNSRMQNQISSVVSEVEKLKNEGGALRDDFIRQMIEANSRIRKFHQSMSDCAAEKRGSEFDQRSLDDMLAQVISETTKEEEAYLAEENIHKQIELEYVDLQRKVSLVEMIMEETESFQDLRRQTSELEQACAYLWEELQKRCACPSCHKDNTDELSRILLEN